MGDDLKHDPIIARRGPQSGSDEDNAHVLDGRKAEKPFVVVDLQEQESRHAHGNQSDHHQPRLQAMFRQEGHQPQDHGKGHRGFHAREQRAKAGNGAWLCASGSQV